MLFRVICFTPLVTIAGYWITRNAMPLWETIIGSLKWKESLARPYTRKFDSILYVRYVLRKLSHILSTQRKPESQASNFREIFINHPFIASSSSIIRCTLYYQFNGSLLFPLLQIPSNINSCNKMGEITLHLCQKSLIHFRQSKHAMRCLLRINAAYALNQHKHSASSQCTFFLRKSINSVLYALIAYGLSCYSYACHSWYSKNEGFLTSAFHKVFFTCCT